MTNFRYAISLITSVSMAFPATVFASQPTPSAVFKQDLKEIGLTSNKNRPEIQTVYKKMRKDFPPTVTKWMDGLMEKIGHEKMPALEVETVTGTHGQEIFKMTFKNDEDDKVVVEIDTTSEKASIKINGKTIPVNAWWLEKDFVEFTKDIISTPSSGDFTLPSYEVYAHMTVEQRATMFVQLRQVLTAAQAVMEKDPAVSADTKQTLKAKTALILKMLMGDDAGAMDSYDAKKVISKMEANAGSLDTHDADRIAEQIRTDACFKLLDAGLAKNPNFIGLTCADAKTRARILNEVSSTNQAKVTEYMNASRDSVYAVVADTSACATYNKKKFGYNSGNCEPNERKSAEYQKAYTDVKNQLVKDISPALDRAKANESKALAGFNQSNSNDIAGLTPQQRQNKEVAAAANAIIDACHEMSKKFPHESLFDHCNEKGARDKMFAHDPTMAKNLIAENMLRTAKETGLRIEDIKKYADGTNIPPTASIKPAGTHVTDAAAQRTTPAPQGGPQRRNSGGGGGGGGNARHDRGPKPGPATDAQNSCLAAGYVGKMTKAGCAIDNSAEVNSIKSIFLHPTCSDKAQTPCNPLMYGFADDNNPRCVANKGNTTKACEDAAPIKDGKKDMQAVIDSIIKKANQKPDDYFGKDGKLVSKAKYDELKKLVLDNMQSYILGAMDACKTSKDTDNCNALKTRASAFSDLIADYEATSFANPTATTDGCKNADGSVRLKTSPDEKCPDVTAKKDVPDTHKKPPVEKEKPEKPKSSWFHKLIWPLLAVGAAVALWFGFRHSSKSSTKNDSTLQCYQGAANCTQGQTLTIPNSAPQPMDPFTTPTTTNPLLNTVPQPVSQ